MNNVNVRLRPLHGSGHLVKTPYNTIDNTNSYEVMNKPLYAYLVSF